jgi:hypothetical protein
LSIGIILYGLAVLLTGIGWFTMRSTFNILLFFIPFFGLLSEISKSNWSIGIIFSALSLLSAVLLLLLQIKKKQNS